MLKFPKAQFERFLAHAKEGLPNEACALLGGIVGGQDAAIKQVYLLTNVDKSPEHFSMDPQEQFAAIKDMRKNGWALLGNLHSHPSSPPRPSEEDKRLAFDPSIRYLILSLMGEEPVVKCFHIRGTEVEQEPIALLEEE
ncbi:MAG: M67 family metallopeptidase [Ethanoligenens sp.]